MEASRLYSYFPSNLSSLFFISVIRWSWYAVYSVCSGCECAGRCFCSFKCSPCSAVPSASLPHLLHFTINYSKKRQLFICYLLMTRLDHLLILTTAGMNKVQSNSTREKLVSPCPFHISWTNFCGVEHSDLSSTAPMC